MLDALLVAGLLLLPIALLTLGVAMLRTPAFGKAYGWVSVTLGVAGAAAAGALLVDVSEIAAVVIFALIVFHLALGWKVYSLSRNPAGSPENRSNGGRAEGESNSTEPINAVQQGGDTP